MRRARWVIGIGMGEDRSDPTACRNVEISSNKCDPTSAGMREALRLAISRSAGARCMSLSFYELYPSLLLSWDSAIPNGDSQNAHHRPNKGCKVKILRLRKEGYVGDGTVPTLDDSKDDNPGPDRSYRTLQR